MVIGKYNNVPITNPLANLLIFSCNAAKNKIPLNNNEIENIEP